MRNSRDLRGATTARPPVTHRHTLSKPRDGNRAALFLSLGCFVRSMTLPGSLPSPLSVNSWPRRGMEASLTLVAASSRERNESPAIIFAIIATVTRSWGRRGVANGRRPCDSSRQTKEGARKKERPGKMLKEGGEMTANSDMGGVIRSVPVSPDLAALRYMVIDDTAGNE